MKKILLYIVLLLNVTIGLAQTENNCTFSGVIQDKFGEPIPYGTIYIPKLATGKMSNMDGQFQIAVPCGTYQIKIQCLGYQTLLKDIKVGSSSKNNIIVLQSKAFQIKSVNINANDEDPAFNVMRKAIVMAKYYKKQIKAYNCNIYVRDFFTVDKIPGMAKLFASKEDLKDMKAGDVAETLLKYSYEYPNKVSEKIISTRNARKDTNKRGSNYINLSFYNLGGSSIISPLSRNAFQVYDFELMSTSIDNGITVNRIKIVPKRKGNDLMSGYIYINDQSWNINSVDVKFKQQMIDVEYKQIYSEVSKYAWMPISHEIKVKAALMGFKGHYKYIASISKINITTNTKIDVKIKTLVDQPINDETLNAGNEPVKNSLNTPKKSKNEKKINDLMSKEKLTKGETMKLVRLVNKENNKEKTKEEEKAELELSRNYKVEYEDSAFTASDKDWKALREVPLSEEETTTYHAVDSLVRVENGDTIINKKRSVIGNVLFFNGTLKSKNKNNKWKIPGIFSKVNLYFNTVDGFLIDKQLLSYQRDFKDGKYFIVTPTLQYAFAREKLMGDITFNSQYNLMKRAHFYFSAGLTSSDFNSNHPMNPYFNSLSTLFFEENYKKIYQKKYLKIGHFFDIKNGFSLKTVAEFADRTKLYNNSDFKIIDLNDVNYSLNNPFGFANSDLFSNINSNKAFNISATLSYTPKYFYRVTKKEKRMLHSKYPTFDLTYKQGIKNIAESVSNYSFIEFSIHQSQKVNLINRISYHVGAGKFLSTKSLFFADYKGFNTQPFYVADKGQINTFKLLQYYNYNSSDYFVEGHFVIEDNVLLLKHLPLLNQTNLTETLYANYLYTEKKDHYYEFGYSLNNLFFLFDVGAYASFVNQQYQTFGVKVSLNFLKN